VRERKDEYMIIIKKYFSNTQKFIRSVIYHYKKFCFHDFKNGIHYEPSSHFCLAGRIGKIVVVQFKIFGIRVRTHQRIHHHPFELDLPKSLF